MSIWSGYQREVLASSARPITNDWMFYSTGRMRTNILQSLRICGQGEALWQLVDQMAVQRLKYDNMTDPQQWNPSFIP